MVSKIISVGSSPATLIWHMAEWLMRWFAKPLGLPAGVRIPLCPLFLSSTVSLKVEYKTVNLTDEGSIPSRCEGVA